MRDESGYFASRNGADESFDKLLKEMQDKLRKRKAWQLLLFFKKLEQNWHFRFHLLEWLLFNFIKKKKKSFGVNTYYYFFNVSYLYRTCPYFVLHINFLITINEYFFKLPHKRLMRKKIYYFFLIVNTNYKHI